MVFPMNTKQIYGIDKMHFMVRGDDIARAVLVSPPYMAKWETLTDQNGNITQISCHWPYYFKLTEK